MALPKPDESTAVLVTGASAGIGEQICRQLAARGHNLIVAARRRSRLDQLAEDIRKQHAVQVEVVSADLSLEQSREQLIAQINEGDKRLVGLCNNAGFGSHGRLTQLPPQPELDQIKLNVEAVHHLTLAFLPEMVKQGSGAVLNVASIVASQPTPGFATYGATKAFVAAFSEALHQELSGSGVSCTCLCPGPVDTEFAQVAGTQEAVKNFPKAAMVSAEEVAQQAVVGMVEGKRVVVPGVATKLLMLGGRLTPRSLLLPALGRSLS